MGSGRVPLEFSIGTVVVVSPVILGVSSLLDDQLSLGRIRVCIVVKESAQGHRWKLEASSFSLEIFMLKNHRISEG